MQALQLTAEWRPRDGYTPSERERTEQRAENANQVYHQPQLALIEASEPEIDAGDDVLVRVRTVGICGSDLQLFGRDDDGYMALAEPVRLPVIAGHEYAGVVEAVGSEATNVAVGDLVCVEPLQWSPDSSATRAGEPGACELMAVQGYEIDGAFAQYAVTKPRYCWSLNTVAERFGEQAALECGALVEPLACVYQGMFIRAGGFRPGSHVTIFGAGPIGLGAVLFARYAGAERVVVLDVSPERLELAKQLGADVALDPSSGEDVVAAILEATGGEGIDMAVESAGAGPHTYPVIEETIALGGKIVQIGIGAAATPVNMVHLQAKQVAIYASMGGSGFGIFRQIVKIAEGGRMPMREMITARFSLPEGLTAVDQAMERRDGKIVVMP